MTPVTPYMGFRHSKPWRDLKNMEFPEFQARIWKQFADNKGFVLLCDINKNDIWALKLEHSNVTLTEINTGLKFALTVTGNMYENLCWLHGKLGNHIVSIAFIVDTRSSVYVTYDNDCAFATQQPDGKWLLPWTYNTRGRYNIDMLCDNNAVVC